MNENRIAEIAEALYHPEHIADDLYSITEEEGDLDNLVEVVFEQIKLLVRERASGSDDLIYIDPAKVASCGAVLDESQISDIVEYINDLVVELEDDEDFDDMLKG